MTAKLVLFCRQSTSCSVRYLNGAVGLKMRIVRTIPEATGPSLPA